MSAEVGQPLARPEHGLTCLVQTFLSYSGGEHFRRALQASCGLEWHQHSTSSGSSGSTRVRTPTRYVPDHSGHRSIGAGPARAEHVDIVVLFTTIADITAVVPQGARALPALGSRIANAVQRIRFRRLRFCSSIDPACRLCRNTPPTRLSHVWRSANILCVSARRSLNRH